MTLATSLREATRSHHAEAERSGAMAALLHGEMALPDYCVMLRNLHVIYEALEPALARHASHAWLAPLHEPRLWRCEALAADLHSLAGHDWAKAIEASEIARQYAERLSKIAKASPELLVAHAYTRYLGDLSGGRVLARIVAKAFDLRGDAGLSFYRFEEPGAAALALAFRSGLEALPDEPATISAIVNEACMAFEEHTRLFMALAPRTA